MGDAEGRDAIWKIHNLAQFFYEPTTALKNKVYWEKINTIHHFLLYLEKQCGLS